jgi:hypothetical protein
MARSLPQNTQPNGSFYKVLKAIFPDDVTPPGKDALKTIFELAGKPAYTSLMNCAMFCVLKF